MRDIQGKFRIRVGPLRLGMFERLMPDGDMLRPLWHLVRLYAGPELDFDVQPILAAQDVPAFEMKGKRARLGWNTWARTRQPPRDAEEAVFRLRE